MLFGIRKTEKNNAYETISLVEEGELQLLEIEPKEQDIDDINMWVYLEDKFNISNEAWHELAMKCKNMPTKYANTQIS